MLAPSATPRHTASAGGLKHVRGWCLHCITTRRRSCSRQPTARGRRRSEDPTAMCRGVNPSNQEWSPEGGPACSAHWLRQLLQPTWCQTYCSAFLWTTPARRRGGSCRLGNPGSPHTPPRLAPWRGHSRAQLHCLPRQKDANQVFYMFHRFIRIAPREMILRTTLYWKAVYSCTFGHKSIRKTLDMAKIA